MYLEVQNSSFRVISLEVHKSLGACRDLQIKVNFDHHLLTEDLCYKWSTALWIRQSNAFAKVESACAHASIPFPARAELFQQPLLEYLLDALQVTMQEFEVAMVMHESLRAFAKKGCA